MTLLMPCFSSHILNKSPFFGLFSATFFPFRCFFVGDFPVQIAPKSSAEVLSSATKSKKVMMCLIKKIYVSDKLCSGMSYSALGHKFNVNESTISILNKVSLNRNTHKFMY